MIEKILIDYLEDELGVPVYAMRPENTPGTFCIIDKTGGTKNNRVSTATVAVQSYAPTMLATIELDEAVKTAMESILELKTIGAVSLMSSQNFTDVVRKVPRYQSVFSITYY